MLAGSKKEVVIKVLRPGTEDVLLTDLNFVSAQPSGCCCFQRGLAQAAYPYVSAAAIASLWGMCKQADGRCQSSCPAL